MRSGGYPAVRSRSCNQRWVSRYSVKMITRSADHCPSGTRIGSSQARMAANLASGRSCAPCAQVRNSSSSARLGAGEQSPFQQRRDEIGGDLTGFPLCAGTAAVGVAGQQLVRALLGEGVVDLQVSQAAHRKAGAAVPAWRQLTLEPTHHHPCQLLLSRLDSAGETLVVEQLQQRSERLQVAVVRRG